MLQAMAEILKGKPLIFTATRLSPELRDFIDYCLVIDYQKRPGYDQLLKHPFFQKHELFNYKTLSILASKGFTRLYDNWNQGEEVNSLS